VAATVGAITIATSGNLTIAQPVRTTAATTLSGSGTINVNAAITGSPARVYGSSGGDVITVTTTGGTPLAVDGKGGSNVLNLNDPSTPVRINPGVLRVDGTPNLSYSDFDTVNINDTPAVIALVGPDTRDRGSTASERGGTAFTGGNANLSPKEQFVQVLYLDELGRASSRAELDLWLPLLSAVDNSSQGEQQRFLVAQAIAGSVEARDHLVKSWYVSFLGRQAQGGEEQGFVNLLGSGQSEEQVLSTLLSSTEFFNRAQTLVAGSDANANYVQALYQLLLDRSASPGEVTNLARAGGRQAMALVVLQSQEFRTDQFEGYYNALLHRPADPTGLNGWVMSNLDMGSVRIDFEASPEFFSNG
jgi:hypothetical protein